MREMAFTLPTRFANLTAKRIDYEGARVELGMYWFPKSPLNPHTHAARSIHQNLLALRTMWRRVTNVRRSSTRPKKITSHYENYKTNKT